LARVTFALGVLLLLTRQALATPSALFSLGTESQALGKTGVAGVSDYGAIVLNPATLALTPERTLWVGYAAARFTPKVDGYSGPRPAQPSFAAGVFALRLPITPNLVPPGLTLGFSLTSPRDVIVRAELPLPETPQFPLLSTRAQALDLALSLGARVSERLYLGLGLRGLAGLEGDVEVASDSSPGGVNDELGLRLAPMVGVLLQLRPGDSVGIVYRAALEAPFEVELRDPGLQGLTLPPLHLDGIAHYDPAEVAVEWAHELGSARVALGVDFQRWSAFGGWLGQTVKCPPDAESCAALPKEEVELRDTVSPRLGASYPLLLPGVELIFRAGYALEPTPLPTQTERANRWDNTRSVVTLGYGVRLLNAPLGFALAYQAHVLHERRHGKRHPEDAPELASVTVSGTAHFFGISSELEY
jgi:long-chain fatty acid transport protein